MTTRMKYALPTMTFPYRITTRLDIMSHPRKQPEFYGALPAFTPTGVRKSALRGYLYCGQDRINEVAWPYVRRLLQLKQAYKTKFSHQRLAKIDRMIASANSTMYSKLSTSVFLFRKALSRNDIGNKLKKRKGWAESDWKKHMDYISQIANPKPVREPEPVSRGPSRSLEEMQHRIEILAQVAPNKMYKRMSQEQWYKDPLKVTQAALTHVTTEREKVLSKPKPSVAAD